MVETNNNRRKKHIQTFNAPGVRTLLTLALIVLIGAMCLGSAAYAGTGILFSDDFNDNSIDASKWTCTGRSRAIEENGILKLETTVTDNFTPCITTSIAIDKTKDFVITRKVKLHYANDYFFGNLAIGDFGIWYGNYIYSSGDNYCPVTGFYIYRNNYAFNGQVHCASQSSDRSARIEPIWDQWFDEKIIYKPTIGLLEYYINENKRGEFNVGTLSSSSVNIEFAPYGWWTGHYQYMDDLVVSQESISVSPTVSSTSGKIGDTLSQPGWGFTPNSTATLHFLYPDGQQDPNGISTEPVGSDGNYSHSYLIPSNAQIGTYYYWAVDGPTNIQSPKVSFTINANQSPGVRGERDFDGDGHTDVLWRNTTTGDVYIWLMDGSKIAGGKLVMKAVPADWDIKAIDDFDGDGKADILWQNTTTGDVVLWFMNGLNIAGSGYAARGVPRNWQILTTGDYNGDGKADILWRNITSGDIYMYIMDGVNKTDGGYVVFGLSGDWQPK
ncbi:MAG: VCBS repeat-containing protein [Magnetococcales bacterium]|nr:VCBS repeat-containing protein [Nitrospirota bacterium]